ncbi:STM4012 family radical SAM protein [Streptomyces sp. NPDC051018]|uniref:STM4012 family radical SAM protein n=1 Tax=Streptomyces sp. NPDC051018 TaxID=3365639 RepID=UPI0037A73528
MSTPAHHPRPYQSYVYAYPHKTAYRPLRPRPALRDLWAPEPKDALSLYLHIPFCEVRCGFCNLFTRIGAPGELATRYLDALDRQATAVRDALGDGGPVRFAAAAFGGGTPTFLTADELDRLCDIAEKRMGADLTAVPLSVETSPSTATADRLAVLTERGTTRISIGVQSFVDEEAKAAVRPQRRSEVDSALGRIRAAGVPVLNIDLIYGIDGQTPQSWRYSLDAALAWQPEELYLYPLYIRPLTGLGRTGPGSDAAWDDQRLRLYRLGRDHLLAHGYDQVSMRMFRRRDAGDTGGTGAASGAGATVAVSGSPVSGTPARGAMTIGPGTRTPGPGAVPGGTAAGHGPALAGHGDADDYACQTDGMIGLGCGARSYTSRLHYSFDYAVRMPGIRTIIDDYTETEDFAHAEVGLAVDEGEARRRHLLQSLLQAEGMETAGYRERFGGDPGDDFGPELARFAALGWLDADAPPGRLRLSAEGLAYSDALGPELFSPAVRAAMAAYEPK